ncbi:hypothetical protein ACLOJK_003703 [Asimina triloba]
MIKTEQEHVEHLAKVAKFFARGRMILSERKIKSVLLNLIQEIEPLDISLIQKDVPADTVDAMKRTISGMLGLLPSDQFHVSIEAFWEPLSKLLVSSMMTGYTLRNAEYRLCLEKNLDIHDRCFERQKEGANHDDCDKHLGRNTGMCTSSEENDLLPECGKNEKDATCAHMDFEGLRELTPEAREYILKLQSHLSSAKMELHEMIRKNAALEMQHFVGEEQNDLLDYLRSLQPEKMYPLNDNPASNAPQLATMLNLRHHLVVMAEGGPWHNSKGCCLCDLRLQVVELSEPTSPELHDTVHSVVHGLLATLSPKMHSKVPPLSENASAGTPNIGKEDCAELLENASLQFQPLISVARDYLARLLFCIMTKGGDLTLRAEEQRGSTVNGD